MSTTKQTYRGWLTIGTGTSGEDDQALFLPEQRYNTSEEFDKQNSRDWPAEVAPLSEIIQEHLTEYGNYLTVRYFITDTERSPEELTEELIRTISGGGEARYEHAYSEITGYLWTDEDLMVGGHDLMAELRNAVGAPGRWHNPTVVPTKFAHIEIEYNRDTPNDGSCKIT